MADEGFGTGPFGEGPFGYADYASESLWRKSIPQGTKDDDARAGGDLERLLRGAASELINRQYRLGHGIPDQSDPLEARSGQEAAETLSVESVERTESNRVTVTLEENENNVDVLENMFPRSEGPNGRPQNDGWVAVIRRVHHSIIRVDAWEREVEFKTEMNVPSDLEVRPPDLLEPLSSNYGVTVDPRDPPDYTRRALYRHTLVRDLKVSDRMFSLLGELYGFDIEVRNLWCIEEDTYDRLVDESPRRVYDVEYPPGSGNVQYMTDIPYERHDYDEIAMDVIPMDSGEDYEADVVVSGSVDLGNDRWRVYISSRYADTIDDIGDVGHWKLVDGEGREHWIEAVDYDKPAVEVYADPLPAEGEATLVHEAQKSCDPDGEWKPAPAYAFYIRTDEVENEKGADNSELQRRISDRIDDYVPLHIRLFFKTYASRTTVTLPFIGTLRTSSIKSTGTSVNILEDTEYDDVAMDEQSMDEGVFQVRTSDVQVS